MFGFGKKRKVFDQFYSSIQAVMGTYLIMRALASSKMEESNLDEWQLKMFEASYIFGVIDLIAHGIDVDEIIIKPDEIFEASVTLVHAMNIIPKEDAEEVFKQVRAFNTEGSAIHKLMYLGAKDAEACWNAMMDGQDSSVSAKAMSLEYFDDKELITTFINEYNDASERRW